MWWWIGTLVYVAGALATFKKGYPVVVESYQADLRTHRPRDGIREDHRLRQLGLAALMVVWPTMVLVLLIRYLLRFTGKVTMKLLFPHGVITKFDREQRALEDEKKYEAARKALEAEGIKVHPEE